MNPREAERLLAAEEAVKAMASARLACKREGSREGHRTLPSIPFRVRGGVAQLVEHATENRGVAGSSPALATKDLRCLCSGRPRPSCPSRPG